MAVLLFLALFFTFTSFSSGQYCICKAGSTDPAPYKKVIDYCCGPQGGVNCAQIQPNGPCYVQGDIVTICSYAANTYYNTKVSLGATCDFGGVATLSSTLPTDVPSGCTFPTTAGGGPIGTGTPITTPTGTPPGGVNAPPGIGMNTPPGIGMNTPPGIGMNNPSGGLVSPIGFSPTGSVDPYGNNAVSLHRISRKLVLLPLTLVSGLLMMWD